MLKLDEYRMQKLHLQHLEKATDESIPESVLKRIIEAGYTAPANDHFRDWHFIQMHK